VVAALVAAAAAQRMAAEQEAATALAAELAAAHALDEAAAAAHGAQALLLEQEAASHAAAAATAATNAAPTLEERTRRLAEQMELERKEQERAALHVVVSAALSALVEGVSQHHRWGAPLVAIEPGLHFCCLDAGGGLPALELDSDLVVSKIAPYALAHARGVRLGMKLSSFQGDDIRNYSPQKAAAVMLGTERPWVLGFTKHGFFSTTNLQELILVAKQQEEERLLAAARGDSTAVVAVDRSRASPLLHRC
jgi:hypothetical protein